MTDLDELLQRDARRWQAEFQPPELAAMVAMATRPARARWAWPILAAVLLLAIPLLTVVLRQTHSAGGHRPGSSASGLKLFGSLPWVKAVSQPDGRSVSVFVDINHPPGGGCFLAFPVLQASTVETSGQVTIRVQAYQPTDYPTLPPDVPVGCAAVELFPEPLLVSLGGPLAGRSLVDASTGKAYQDVQAADLPSLSKPPPGYLDEGSSPAQPTDLPPGLVDRTYRKGGEELKLIRGRAGSRPFYSLNQVEATGTVLGHPARVGGPGSQYRCAEWSDSSYLWQLCATGRDVLPSAPELLIVANSIS